MTIKAANHDATIHPRITKFFDQHGWTFFDFQRQSCKAFHEQKSGLIHSPTGTGKTLAAWLGPVNQYLLEKPNIDARHQKEKLRVLWITPLRALAADTQKSLLDSVKSLDIPWSVERRTGDTTSAQRARQRKNLPTCLITTPESLSLLLSYKDTAAQFASLKAVIVDEWHELLGTKRGVQLELCLAHLRNKNTTMRTWGLSATIGNVSQALEVLLGSKSTKKNSHQRALIKSEKEKHIEIRSLIPESVENFPWAGHMGTRLLPKVIDEIDKAESTLLFTNTRSQAEIWFENILRAKPEWLEKLGLHHGSLDRKVRDYIEDGLRAGVMKCVVCTSSLDLGVDFSPVDQVIQVGSPKGVARLLQRAGRSGHSPGRVSEVICVPTHAFELVEIAAARQAAQRNRIESRIPLTLCLDVLVQHCVTLALSGNLFAAKTFDEVKRTYCFAQITEPQWQWAIDFITRGGDALQHYPDYRKVIRQGRKFSVEDRRIARLHRMSVGTITSDASMRVKFLKGNTIGTIEESFISRLKRDDAFLFNGRLLTLVQVKDMTAYVKRAEKKKRIVPRWQGGRMPLSTELSDSVRTLISSSRNSSDLPPEIQSINTLLGIQQQWSALPKSTELLVEKIKSREGFHIFFYPFAGRLVHEGLAALVAYRLTQRQPITYTTSANDYGFELLSKSPTEIDDDVISSVFSEDQLLNDIIKSINASEMAKRQFRDIARIAGLIIQGHPGNRKSTRQVQASSGLIFDVLQNYDSDNLLLEQSTREVLQSLIEFTKLQSTLASIKKQQPLLCSPEKLTPLAFPLWAERLRGQILSSEKWQDRVQRMIDTLESKIRTESIVE